MAQLEWRPIHVRVEWIGKDVTNGVALTLPTGAGAGTLATQIVAPKGGGGTLFRSISTSITILLFKLPEEKARVAVEAVGMRDGTRVCRLGGTVMAVIAVLAVLATAAATAPLVLLLKGLVSTLLPLSLAALDVGVLGVDSIAIFCVW